MAQYQVYEVITHRRLRTETNYDDAAKYAEAHKTIEGTDAYVVEVRPIYTTRRPADDFATIPARPLASQGQARSAPAVGTSAPAKREPDMAALEKALAAGQTGGQ